MLIKNITTNKSTIILLFGGLVTKVLGMIIKIVSTRLLGSEGIGTYMLIMPSFSLLLSISQFSFPTTISLLINFILMFIIFFASDYISINLLHNENTRLGLKYLGFALPFISISSIIRGYFFGKQKMFPHTLSNVIEQLFRLLIILIFLPKLLKYGTVITVSTYILLNILSEIISIIVFLLLS